MKIDLKPACLIKRYKRFLADVELSNGQKVTMHCANTGAMTGCAIPHDTIWYSTSENKKRKYAHSWELTHTQNDHWICVNTLRANQLVDEAIQNGVIKEFKGYSALKREVSYGNENSKADFFLVDKNKVKTYIEVKSVTLLNSENNQGYFPDTVTMRGQKHLRELIDTVKQGNRAVLLFAVLHSGINCVQAAEHIDPQYAKLLYQAAQNGVEILAYKAEYTPTQAQCEISLKESLPVKVTR